MRRLIPFAFLTLLLLAGTSEAQAQADMTGRWDISYETQRGATTSTFTFVQDGNTFTGTVEMAMRRQGGGGGGGTREIEITEGIIDGNTFTFSIAMGMGERSISFSYSGTVDGNSMEGTMTTPRGENAFTGVKK